MRKRHIIYYFLFLAAVVLTDFPQTTVAAGFGVSPSTIDFAVEKGSSVSRQLIIYNTGPAAQFTAISENPAITVKPGNGILGESEMATVTLTAAGKNVGRSGGEILISLVPDNGNSDKEVKFSLGTRVGVSLSVVESALPSASLFVGMLTTAVIVAAGLSVYLQVRRRTRHPLYAGWRRE